MTFNWYCHEDGGYAVDRLSEAQWWQSTVSLWYCMEEQWQTDKSKLTELMISVQVHGLYKL